MFTYASTFAMRTVIDVLHWLSLRQFEAVNAESTDESRAHFAGRN
ncbi:hypothetical protein ACWC5C_11065 [Streptomyces sp. NPDC001700]